MFSLKAPFLWLIIPLMAGIMLAAEWTVNIYFTGMLFLIIAGMYTGFYLLNLSQSPFLRKVQMCLPVLMCFQLGQLLYQMNDPDNIDRSFENNCLPGDKLMVEIRDLSKTSSEYKKCEVNVFNVIRYNDTTNVSGKMVLFIEDPANVLKRKQICVLQAELHLIVNNNNPGEFDSRQFWQQKGIRRSAFISVDQYKVIGVAGWEVMDFFIGLRERFATILDQHLTGQENAVAKGLILGDRSSIDSEVTRQFGNTGAMHVLAVSGLHVAILVQILTIFLGLFSRWISKKQALLAALILVWIYSALTGFSPSVARSAVMFTILAGSTLLNRNYSAMNCLAFSAFLLLVWNPYFLFDIGFQLSYLAMAGIFLFNQSLNGLFYTRAKWIQAAWEGTMVGIAAQIMTVPLTLYYFHQFPNYFILTNLGLMIFSFLVLALGIALFATAWLTLFAKLIAILLMFSMFLMLWIIDFVDKLPGSVSSGFVLTFWEVVLLFTMILLLFVFLKQKRLKPVIGILTICLVWIAFLVNNRFERMTVSQICFIKEREPTFIVKSGRNNFCFYASRKQTNKKAKYIAEAYEKIYPGKIHYFEISGAETTVVRSKATGIEIRQVHGGYVVKVNDSHFFYATSIDNEANLQQSTVIYAPWLSDITDKNHLSAGAITFDL